MEIEIKIKKEDETSRMEFADYNEAIQFLDACWSKDMDEKEAKEISLAFA